ncbi:hypothetical protein ABEW24_13530 [Paenibacillus jamilae]|uniref:hypothetical protein n=1 Tax=Paenibacillus TaxID=44249 RepID=UPI000AD9EA78|nr:hypothetical protein [Paenibacillus polymyxa]
MLLKPICWLPGQEHGRRFPIVAGEVRKIAEYALNLWAEIDDQTIHQSTACRT